MVTTSVLDHEWLAYGPKCVELFLEFWNGWPPLGPSQQLFVFLAVKYTAGPSPAGILSALLAKLLGSGKSVSASDVHRALGQLTQAEWQRLAVVLVPKLDGVNHREAENWAKSREVKQIGAISEELVAGVGKFFRSYKAQDPAARVPMDLLADNLKLMLRNDAYFER